MKLAPHPALARVGRFLTGPAREVQEHSLRVLAVGAGLFTLLDVVLGVGGSPTTGWAGPYAGLAMQVLVDFSLLLLLRFPRAVAGLAVLVSLAMLASDTWAPGLLVPETQLSPVTVPRAAPMIIIWLVLNQPRRVSFPVTVVLALLAGRVWMPTWSETPFGLLSTVVPALAALYFGARRELLQSLRDRAERAEREQYLLAEQARFEERRRLAVEMHDVVTHRLSLMVLHAGALEVSSSEPGVRKAADDIRVAGTQALDELRDLVGVLRSTSGHVGLAAATTRAVVEHPAELAAESAAVGVPVVELDVEGEPSDVSPIVARTAYRVVQEALTNVRKHAPGSTVRIRVHYRPEEVQVRVVNTAAGEAADPVLAASGSGSGLTGLEQRVGLVGGSLAAGPTEDGGFRVDAILPGYVPTPESRLDDPPDRGR